MTSVQATYTILFDLARDGTFTHPTANCNLSNRMLAIDFTVGMGDAYDVVSKPSRLMIDLVDSDRALNPENTDSPYYGLFKRGVVIWIKATEENGTVRSLWLGKLKKVTPVIDPFTYKPIVKIVAEDPMIDLLHAEYFPALQTDVRVDEALTALFDAGVIAWPYESSFWILEGSMVLDTDTYLFENTFTDFEEARTVIPYVGDNAGNEKGVSAQGFIREVMASEAGGRFYWDPRAGKFKFHERYHDTLASSVATITGDQIEDADYRFADDLVTRVTVNYEQRGVGTPASELWVCDTVPFSLPPNGRKLVARYRDANNKSARVGAQDVIIPFYGVDIIANTAEDGSGSDAKQYIGWSFTPKASSAEIFIHIAAGAPTVFITTLKLRGTPISTFNRGSASAVNVSGIENYGQLEKTYDLKAVASEEFAQDYAALMAARFGVQEARFASITVVANQNATLMTQVLTRTVGDRITVNHALHPHLKDYAIVGEHHTIRAGAAPEHRCTWTVKPISRETFWLVEVVGFGELDETTILAL